MKRRLDNVVYRSGFAVTRRATRQLVSHKKVMVNGKVVNIASYMVAPGDKIEVKEAAKSNKALYVPVSLLNSVAN